MERPYESSYLDNFQEENPHENSPNRKRMKRIEVEQQYEITEPRERYAVATANADEKCSAGNPQYFSKRVMPLMLFIVSITLVLGLIGSYIWIFQLQQQLKKEIQTLASPVEEERLSMNETLLLPKLNCEREIKALASSVEEERLSMNETLRLQKLTFERDIKSLTSSNLKQFIAVNESFRKREEASRADIKALKKDLLESMSASVAEMKNYAKAGDRATLVATGWHKAPNDLIYKLFSTRKNYRDAKNFCQSFDGSLIIKGLRDQEVFRFFSQSGVIQTESWIGYDDIRKEGTWEWLDGGVTNNAVIRWRRKQPDDGGGGEDCAHIDDKTLSSAEINDDQCAGNRRYICEI